MFCFYSSSYLLEQLTLHGKLLSGLWQTEDGLQLYPRGLAREQGLHHPLEALQQAFKLRNGLPEGRRVGRRLQPPQLRQLLLHRRLPPPQIYIFRHINSIYFINSRMFHLS